MKNCQLQPTLERGELFLFCPDDSDCIDVAIVGAGLTGSYMAWHMRNNDQSNYLYEATNRIGGRLLTKLLFNLTDVYIDSGDMFFSSKLYEKWNETFQMLGLNVRHFPSAEDTEYVLYLRGQFWNHSTITSHNPYNLERNTISTTELIR